MKKRKVIALLLCLCSIIIIIYQLKYSESARVKENLDDFSKMENLISVEVSKKDIKNIFKPDKDYSFTVIPKDEENLQKLGKVDIVNNEEKLVGSFVLFKDKDEYVVYMRDIYMSID